MALHEAILFFSPPSVLTIPGFSVELLIWLLGQQKVNGFLRGWDRVVAKCVSCLNSPTGAPAVRGTQHIGGYDSGRSTRWIALSSTVIKWLRLLSSFPIQFFFSSQWIYSIVRHETEGLLIESWSFKLQEDIWTSPYSLEMRDLISRICGAEWDLFIYFFYWEGNEEDPDLANELVLTFSKKMAYWTVTMKSTYGVWEGKIQTWQSSHLEKFTVLK